MPPEPNKKMDTLLRAAAQKRRAEARSPFELHPATRNLLQAEVDRRRQEPAAPKTSWFTTVLAFWPRFAVGGVLAAALALTIFIRLQPASQSSASFKIAKNSPSEPKQVDRRDDLSLADQKLAEPQRRIVELSRNGSLDRQLPRSLTEKSKTEMDSPLSASAAAAPTTLSATPVVAFALADEEHARAENLGEAAGAGGKLDATRRAEAATINSPARVLAVALPALSTANRYQNQNLNPQSAARFGLVLPTEAESKTATADTAKLGRAATGLSRENLVPTSAAKPALAAANNPPAFLNSFTVEQTDGQLRFIDEDGSIYLGALVGEAADGSKIAAASAVARAGERGDELLREKRQPGAEASAPGQAVAQAQRALALGAEPANQIYFFRVAGTNRSLNQLVVFNGNFVAPTNALVSNEQLGVELKVGQSASRAAPVSLFFIQGQAQLGENAPVEINAAPLER